MFKANQNLLNQQLPLRRNLLSLHVFKSGVGLKNLVNQTYNATLGGDARFTGNELFYPGTNGYANIGNIPGAGSTAQLTVAVLAYTNTTTGGGPNNLRNLCEGSSVGNNPFLLRYATASQNLEFYIRTSGNFYGAAASMTWEPYKWYIFIGRFQTNTVLDVWANGKRINASTVVPSTAIDTPQTIHIGNSPSDSTRSWSGGIKLCAIWNRAITNQEIVLLNIPENLLAETDFSAGRFSVAQSSVNAFSGACGIPFNHGY
jgi:hypothetical protein